MAAIPNGIAKDGGKAVGTAAAAGMLAMRTGDHFDDVVPYVQPTPGPGVFEPIAATTPVDVKLGNVRPFTFDSQSKYRPDEPYELTSKRYARDVDELEDIGGVISSRTPFQTEHARFFSDQAYARSGTRAQSQDREGARSEHSAVTCSARGRSDPVAEHRELVAIECPVRARRNGRFGRKPSLTTDRLR